MWTIKKFKTASAMRAWMDKNAGRYQMTVIFIENGYALEYRALVTPRLPR